MVLSCLCKILTQPSNERPSKTGDSKDQMTFLKMRNMGKRNSLMSTWRGLSNEMASECMPLCRTEPISQFSQFLGEKWLNVKILIYRHQAVPGKEI